MKRIKLTSSDTITIISLAINSFLIVFIAYWSFKVDERISKLEYDELAPKIAIRRKVKLDLIYNDVIYEWTIRNNGRKLAENVTIALFSTSELPLETCILGVPYDAIAPRINDMLLIQKHIIFENIQLPPEGTISVFCNSTPGSLTNFAIKHNILPDKVLGLHCLNSNDQLTYEISYSLPDLGITGNNIEQQRVNYCITDTDWFDLYR